MSTIWLTGTCTTHTEITATTMAPSSSHSAQSSASESDLASLKRVLREAGLRATSARVAVLRCLEAASAPLSHSDVCDAIAPLGFDRATTYRNLNDLAEAGLARRADLGDHVWRFELVHTHDEGHDAVIHPHFTCSECGAVACLPEGTVSFSTGRGIPRSVKEAQVEVQLRGVCDTCG
jgi:Fur family ferric uptake transcriptional regulator